jgi:hypothetical protein
VWYNIISAADIEGGIISDHRCVLLSADHSGVVGLSNLRLNIGTFIGWLLLEI